MRSVHARPPICYPGCNPGDGSGRAKWKMGCLASILTRTALLPHLGMRHAGVLHARVIAWQHPGTNTQVVNSCQQHKQWTRAASYGEPVPPNKPHPTFREQDMQAQLQSCYVGGAFFLCLCMEFTHSAIWLLCSPAVLPTHPSPDARGSTMHASSRSGLIVILAAVQRGFRREALASVRHKPPGGAQSPVHPG